MILAITFLACSVGGKPMCAPPINPRFSVRYVVKQKGCICTDSGQQCVCVNGECRCADCPTKSPSTPIPASQPRALGRVEACSNGSCQPQAVSIGGVNRLESYQSSPCANGQCGRTRRGWFRR